MNENINEAGADMGPIRRRPSFTVPRMGSRMPMASWLAIIVVLLAGGMWWWNGSLAGFGKDWQAVFLSNGQVYFGKVAKQNKAEVILEDIYYLQVTRPLQQTQEGQQQANPEGELSLVKLGNELHGPTDGMHVNRDQILFMEDLKDDSNVVQAIVNYKNGNQAAGQPINQQQ